MLRGFYNAIFPAKNNLVRHEKRKADIQMYKK